MMMVKAAKIDNFFNIFEAGEKSHRDWRLIRKNFLAKDKPTPFL